jgi:hypothetical protein
LHLFNLFYVNPSAAKLSTALALPHLSCMQISCHFCYFMCCFALAIYLPTHHICNLSRCKSPFGLPQILLAHHQCNYISVEHSCVSVEHSYVSVEHSCVSLKHSYVSVEHSRVSLEHSYVSVEHSCVSVEHSCVSLDHSCAPLDKYFEFLNKNLSLDFCNRYNGTKKNRLITKSVLILTLISFFTFLAACAGNEYYLTFI